MIEQVFAPAYGSTTAVNNDTVPSTTVDLPASCSEVALTNTSATARVHVIVTPATDTTNFAAGGITPTTSTGMPILPGQQIRIRVGSGRKVIRTIATSIDGQIIITPGNGG